MTYYNFIQNHMPIEKALSSIKSNNSVSYCWFAVKNKKGCIFELGGRNYKGILELKAYIPKFKEGKYLSHSNGYIDHDYSIENNGDVSFPNHSSFSDKVKDTENFINFIAKKDFRKYSPKIKSINIVEKSTKLTITL